LPPLDIARRLASAASRPLDLFTVADCAIAITVTVIH
jgi:hypothetical protein